MIYYGMLEILIDEVGFWVALTVSQSYSDLEAEDPQSLKSMSKNQVRTQTPYSAVKKLNHSTTITPSCPVSTVVNVENNEIRIENSNVSYHILLALFSTCLTFVSIYSTFSSVSRTDTNVLNSLKQSFGSVPRMEENAE